MADWRKAVGWTAVGIGVLLIVIIVAAIVVLKAPAFHGYLLTKIEQKADQATGARVEIQNFQFHITSLTADVYGLTIHGNEQAGAKPLLQVQHATIGIKIRSILHREFNLSELLIDRPIVNLLVDKEGHSNLPNPPQSQSSGKTDIFRLAVGHVLLTNGEIDAHDEQIPVAANLDQLRTEITFDSSRTEYHGAISYQNGLIQYKDLRPMPHALRASFDATPSQLDLKSFRMNLGGSRLALDGSVRDYTTSPVANAHYMFALHTQDFAAMAGTAKPAGDVIVQGKLAYHSVAGIPLLENVDLDGGVQSAGLSLSAPQAALKIERISGKYSLRNGNFRADALTLNLFNGQVVANGTVQDVTSARRSRFSIQAEGLSLNALKASLRSASGQPLPVSGTINASADAVWARTLQNLHATGAITMHGSVASNQPRHYPLEANVHVDYDARRSLITVPSSYIQLPAASIRAQGQIGGHSNLVLTASVSDLHQLAALASGLRGSTNGAQTAVPEIYGSANLNANVQGTLQNPQIAAQVSAVNLRVNQSLWNSLQLSLAANPSQFSIQNATLTSARQGQLRFTAQAGLHHWSYLAGNPISADVQIAQLHISELEDAANLHYPITGQLFANVRLSGSELNPAGQGNVQVQKANISDQPLKNVAAQFHAANGTINSHVTLGKAVADVSYTPRTRAYRFALQTPSIDISKAHMTQARNLPLKGSVTLNAKGQGTVENPQLSATLQIDQLQVRDTSFSRVDADLNVSDHLARIALNSGVGGAALRGNATVHLTPGYYTEASLDTSRFDLSPFLAIYMPGRPEALHGETELHASVRGPLADKTKLEAHLTIPVLDASYQAIRIAATGPIRADFSRSVLVLQPASIKGTDTALEFQGRIPIRAPGAVTFSAHGAIGLELLQMFNSDVRSGGSVALDVNTRGTFKNPQVSGQIRFQNASFATEEMPLGVENLNALMQVSNTAVQITNGSGELGGGKFQLGGSIIYRPQLQMNVAVSAKSVRVRYPEGVRTVFDSDLTLSGNRQASLLQGRVLIDSVSFTSDFDLSSFASQFTGVSAPPTGQSMADNLKLKIAVQSTNQLNAGTAQLGIEGSANLQVIGTAANPVVIGRTDLTSGDIFFAKNQYHLERGIITFANPNQTEPVLNILITTIISQYNLSITIRGPIQKLQTNYVSDPPLPPVDIINLIARGQTTGAPGGFGANEVLAAGLGQVSNEVTKLTGIAGLQIDPLADGANNNPSARIGLQKRVTKDFVFTFSTDVTQPQSESVQGEYQINKRWSVSVVRKQAGGVAVDGRFHTNF
jgi:translocation and assembly module TamB